MNFICIITNLILLSLLNDFFYLEKCFHTFPLSVFIDRFISPPYNHDSYFIIGSTVRK